MELNEYQNFAKRTMNLGEIQDMPLVEFNLQLAVFGLGLGGEAGEATELIKKHLGHGHSLDLPKLTGELGDVLWYIAAIATMCGISLDEIAVMNREKLKARYPDGFTQQASIQRQD